MKCQCQEAFFVLYYFSGKQHKVITIIIHDENQNENAFKMEMKMHFTLVTDDWCVIYFFFFCYNYCHYNV